MIIKYLERYVREGITGVCATVIWENRDRPEEIINFEVYTEHDCFLNLNPDAFLLACALPAMRYGERRIKVDAPVSSEVVQGLENAMSCIQAWSGGERQPVPIEATNFVDRSAIKIFRAAGFFSGGIDALAMIKDNHSRFSQDHPRYITDGILVHGVLEGEGLIPSPGFQHVYEANKAIASDIGINLIQVNTNIYSHFRDLDLDYSFWRYEYHGSFLAAIAHALGNMFTSASIASTYDYQNLEPWGSHPLLDPLYSTSTLRIHHENAALSRLEKTKLVGEWGIALKNLRVCNEIESYEKGNYNCGGCEKCVRTMLALLSLGLLDKVETFKDKTVTKEKIINTCYLSDNYEENCYRELVPGLFRMGREDLVEGIEVIIKRYRKEDFKGLIKRADEFFFGGNFIELVKSVS